jgi:hypothetical protein
MAPSVLGSCARATGRWLSTVALVSAARVAAAQPSAQEPIRIEDQSEASCTDPARFHARVVARTSRARLARPGEVSRVFVVQTARRGDAVSGRLTIRDPDGRETYRDIRGRDCAEVVDGLSLVAALAVEPAAALDTTAPPPSAPPTSTVTGPPNTAGAAGSAGTTGAAQVPAPASVPAPLALHRASRAGPGADDRGEPSDRSVGGWTAGLAAHALMLGGVAPEPLWGGGLSIDLQAEGGGVFAVRAALGVDHAEHATFQVERGVARFTYNAGALELCPLRLGWPGALTVAACARAAVGLVTTTGAGADASVERSVRRGWADIGAGVRLGWPLSLRWAFELQGGCMFPLRRDSYGFGPGSFHEVPGVAGVVAAGIHLRVL